MQTWQAQRSSWMIRVGACQEASPSYQIQALDIAGQPCASACLHQSLRITAHEQVHLVPIRSCEASAAHLHCRRCIAAPEDTAVNHSSGTLHTGICRLCMQELGGAGAAMQGLQRAAAKTLHDLLELHAALAEQHAAIRCACLCFTELHCCHLAASLLLMLMG